MPNNNTPETSTNQEEYGIRLISKGNRNKEIIDYCYIETKEGLILHSNYNEIKKYAIKAIKNNKNKQLKRIEIFKAIENHPYEIEIIETLKK